MPHHMTPSTIYPDGMSDLLKTIYIHTQDEQTLSRETLFATLPQLDTLPDLLARATADKLITVDGDKLTLTSNGQKEALRLLMPQTEAVENFVKSVYVLQQRSNRVSTNALRDVLRITAPSVTDMAKRLMDGGLLDHRKYHGVRLTALGERIALRILRRHRLIELFLVQELGYALHEVHSEAEALEHAVSDQFIEAIDAKLGHPHFDPHGDPIPTDDGTIQRRDLHPLSELALHTTARVSRLLAEESDMLQHILDRGFQLNTPVEVSARDPFQGPLTVLVGDKPNETVIGYSVADTILVEVVE
jgi:DtxR family Mn-dependent transcriptional regulator